MIKISNNVYKIMAFLFILMPILNQYYWGPFTFEMIVGILTVGLILLEGGKIQDKNRIFSYILVYIFYATTITMLNVFFIDTSAIQVVLRLVLMIFLTMNATMFIPNHCEFEWFLKVYTYVVFILSCLIVIQFFLQMFFGITLSLLIPGMKLNYGEYTSDQFAMWSTERLSQGWYYRPSSVFIEVAHHAQYALPCIYLLLIKTSKSKFESVTVVLASIGVILTASTLGVVGAAIIWLVYLIKQSKKKTINDIIKLVLIILLIGIFIYFALRIDAVSFYFNMKMDEFYNGRNLSNSFTIRLLRGWECFKQLKFPQQLFGCGYGNGGAFISKYGISTIYDSAMSDKTYMNGVSTLLFNFGIIGTVLYIYLFFVKCPSKCALDKSIMLCLFVLMIASSIFYAPSYLLCLSILFFNKKQSE